MLIMVARYAVISTLMFRFATAALAQEEVSGDEPARTPFYGLTDITLISTLRAPDVQQELKLDKAQSQTLLESLLKINPSSFSEPRMQFLSDTREEAKRRAEDAIKKTLNEEQFRRLQQLDLQRQGGRALLVTEVAEQLELTAEQQKRLKSIREAELLEFRASRALNGGQPPSRDDPQVVTRRKQLEADLVGVLTPEQAIQWRAMTGAPFEGPKPYLEFIWRSGLQPHVQKELGLSESETAAMVQSLQGIQEEVNAEMLGKTRENRDDSEKQRQFEQTIETVRSSLTVSQWNRLQELLLQQSGTKAFAQPDVANALQLTQEQRKQVREVVGTYLLRGLIPPRPPKEKTDLVDILTPDQAKQWEAMQGAKIDPSLLRPNFSPVRKQRDQ